MSLPVPSPAAAAPSSAAAGLVLPAAPVLLVPPPLSSATTTTPVIHGCTMHRYGYSPGSSNSTSNVSPGRNKSLLNSMGESGVLVTVCAAVSSLDHVTVVPGATDTPAGM